MSDWVAILCQGSGTSGKGVAIVTWDVFEDKNVGCFMTEIDGL